MEINKGDIFYKREGLYFYKCHVVEILDKEKTPQVVYKYFGKHKQYWHYRIEDLLAYSKLLECGVYKKEKGKYVNITI